jgi:osmotically-inducible protein OsmY
MRSLVRFYSAPVLELCMICGQKVVQHHIQLCTRRAVVRAARNVKRTCMTKSDLHLKADVEAELACDPRIDASKITVTTDQGAVALHGTVGTFAAKWLAEDAVMRVRGARSIAQHLSVAVQPQHERPDEEIAEAVHHALKWDVFVPHGVTSKVHRGVVTLMGQATWNFQRASAARAILHLAGVVEVINSIVLKPEVSQGQLQDGIETALRRQATVDGKAIQVSTSGTTITLSGHTTWDAAKNARHAAWAVPGVMHVVDQMIVMS